MKEKRQIDPKMIREVPEAGIPIPGILSLSGPLQWEYQSIVGPRLLDLNKEGREGWELVSVIPQPGDQAVFYFRRPKG